MRAITYKRCVHSRYFWCLIATVVVMALSFLASLVHADGLLTPQTKRNLAASIGDSGAKEISNALDLLNVPGTKFFVDSSSVNASDNNAGIHPSAPLATLDTAIGLCTASKGDLVVLMPGHSETKSTSGSLFAADVAGVRIVGLGSGSTRPMMNITHSSGACTISAAGVTLQNVVFVAGADSIAAPLTISAPDWTLRDIEWRDTTDIEMVRGVVTTTLADRGLMEDCVYNGYTGGDACVNAVRLIGVDGLTMRRCRFMGNFSTAAVEMVTTACTKIDISDVDILETGATSFATIIADTQGSSTWNARRCFGMERGSGFSGGSGQPLAFDGNNRPAGQVFVIQSTVTSSSIPNNSQTAGAITGASSGAVVVEQMVFETDATGLAAPTNIEITTDNAKGLTGAGAPNLLPATSDLGGNKTIVGTSVSGAKLPFTLESGKKVYIHGDDAGGTGAGTVRITMHCRRLTDGANIAAANLP